MAQPSIRYQLIEAKLDCSLADFIAARWPQKGWRKIADEIETATGVQVDRQTLANWFAGRIELRAVVREDA